MDVLVLSRVQFALTAVFHFIFPCLTIGMAWLNVIFLGRYYRSNTLEDRQTAYFWINLFTVTFAMGVASGLVMVFQFGTNWGDYARYVGDIFGAPLAAEALLAFFLEATFLGVLVWGRGRVSNGFYWFSSIMVAFGATLSAFWIVVANSWQQTPAGYVLVEGRPQLSDFMAAVFNPSTWPRYLHTVDACIIAGALFVAGISAWFLLKRQEQHKKFALKSIRLALIVLLAASIFQLALGHWHSVQVAQTQPVKLAAYEGHFETSGGVPMLLFGIPDAEANTTHMAIGLPNVLSLMVAGDPNAEIAGLNDFPRDTWPPLLSSFFSYHIMVYLGGYFVLLGLIGLILLYRQKLIESAIYLKIACWSIPLGVLAAEFGWMAAELGRQPWVVYDLLRTADAVSYNVPAPQVLLSIIIFTAIFALLFVAYIFLLSNKLKLGPEAVGDYDDHIIEREV